VTTSPKRERRQHERFPQVLDVHTRCLLSGNSSSDQQGNPLPKEFDGRIQNLSNGGACILSSYSLPLALFVCCNFPTLEAPVSIPILMQVRWTAKRSHNPPTYLTGFEFVI
jgi:hypothetical protein